MKDKKPSKPKSLGKNDADLWKVATDDVKRLPGKKYHEAIADMPGDEGSPEPKEFVEPPSPKAKVPPQKPPGRGLDRRTAERLRRGQMKIDARLDLHGMNQADAHAALRHFLLDGYDRGRRCVLVITGKGTRSPEEGGVLRRKVPQWLELEPLDALVLLACPARPADGGAGALYILLRRRRD